MGSLLVRLRHPIMSELELPRICPEISAPPLTLFLDLKNIDQVIIIARLRKLHLPDLVLSRHRGEQAQLATHF